MSVDLNRRDLLVTGGVAATIAAMPETVLAQKSAVETKPEKAADTTGVPNNEKRIPSSRCVI